MGHAVLLAALAVAAERPLTIGSPAPPLALGAFLKGEPVKEMAKGTVYVVEFTGTQCAPCLKVIPHLTELQKKHPQVVFISVFSEPEEGVRKYMTQHGDRMGFRVAVDRDYVMDRTWTRAANLTGIPTVFVVGGDGAFAWIGSPFDLDGPLQQLLDGNLDARFDRAKLLFKQAEHVAWKEREARDERSNRVETRLRELLAQKKWAEAIRVCEQGSTDFPENWYRFRDTKLFALAANPDTADAALEYAAHLSATAKQGGGDLGRHPHDFDIQIAKTLCGSYRTNGNPLFLDTALLLLSGAEKRHPGRDIGTDQAWHEGTRIHQVFAQVYALREDFKAAAARQKQLVDLVRARKYRPEADGDRGSWDRETKELTEYLEGVLKEYEAKAK